VFLAKNKLKELHSVALSLEWFVSLSVIYSCDCSLCYFWISCVMHLMNTTIIVTMRL